MARGKRTFLNQVEALLRRHGIHCRRHSPHHLRVLGMNVFSSGKIHLDGASGSLPNGGMAELRRLLQERGVLRHRTGGEAGEGRGGGAHHRTGGVRERDAERRLLELRIERLTEARERAERERDEAVAKLRKAERRLSGKPAEEDALEAPLRERPAAANARTPEGPMDDRKFRAAKRALVRICHPEQIAARGAAHRAALMEMCKDIWAELDRIDGI
jgi:hypothetical protein